MPLDLTHLTLGQLALVLVVVTIVDVASGMAGAISARTFDVAYVATFLESHVLKRVFPIVALALISYSLGVSGAGQAIFALALGGLVAYVVETVKSVATNVPGSPTAGALPSGSPTP